MDRAEFVRKIETFEFSPMPEGVNAEELHARLRRLAITSFDQGYLAGLDKGEELFHRALQPEQTEEKQ